MIIIRTIIIALITIAFLTSCNSDNTNIINPPTVNDPHQNLYDYFPLKVGNKWQYHYIYSGYTPAGGFSNAAKIDWEVLEKNGNFPGLTFKLKETLFDSTDNSIITNYFNIITDSSDSISLIGKNKFFANKIRRYYGADNGEIVGTPYPVYEFKKNVGFIGYSYGFGQIHTGNFWWAKLINYTLN